MARYRKVDVRMRADEKFRALSKPQPNGQDCWIYLLTNRYTTNIPGLYAVFEETLARDLGWPLEGFREAFREVSAQGMARADWEAGLVFIPNAISYDSPQSPNVVRSWRDSWDELPECELKDEARYELAGFVDGISEAFAKAFAEACGKGSVKASANPEPEPEPDPEQEPEPEPDPERVQKPAQIARTRVDEIRALLAKNWGAWGTKVLLPDGSGIAEVARLLDAYAEASGEAAAALAERAVKVAFVEKLLPSWSFTAPATPSLFIRKWDEIQAVLGGIEPTKRGIVAFGGTRAVEERARPKPYVKPVAVDSGPEASSEEIAALLNVARKGGS